MGPEKKCRCGKLYKGKGNSCNECSKEKKPATMETREPEEGISGMSSFAFAGHAAETKKPTSEWQTVTRRRYRKRATRAEKSKSSSEDKLERTMQRQYARGLK